MSHVRSPYAGDSLPSGGLPNGDSLLSGERNLLRHHSVYPRNKWARDEVIGDALALLEFHVHALQRHGQRQASRVGIHDLYDGQHAPDPRCPHGHAHNDDRHGAHREFRSQSCGALASRTRDDHVDYGHYRCEVLHNHNGAQVEVRGSVGRHAHHSDDQG